MGKNPGFRLDNCTENGDIIPHIKTAWEFTGLGVRGFRPVAAVVYEGIGAGIEVRSNDDGMF